MKFKKKKKKKFTPKKNGEFTPYPQKKRKEKKNEGYMFATYF